MTLKKNEFKIYSKLTRKTLDDVYKSDDDNSEDRILLSGVASTTSRDLQDEVVSSEAIQMMAEQAPELNIHGDHWYGLEDVIGAIKDVDVTDDSLAIDFLITKRHTPIIRDLLETGINLGLSIGGYVTDYDSNENIIKAIELREISLTAMPANWDTFGTVTSKSGVVESTCLSGACYNIIKSINGEKNMSQEVESTKADEAQETPITLEDVKDFLDEYMAEKEATMVEEVTNKVEAQLESLVESKVKELLDDTEEVEEETEEPEKSDEPEDTKADETSEEEEEEDVEEEDDTKSTDPEVALSVPTVDVEKAIQEGVAKALGDVDFADMIASKMFNHLDKSRDTSGSKFNEFIKSQKEESSQTEETLDTSKSTYTTQETAELLMKKQQSANPILGAVIRNIQ